MEGGLWTEMTKSLEQHPQGARLEELEELLRIGPQKALAEFNAQMQAELKMDSKEFGKKFHLWVSGTAETKPERLTHKVCKPRRDLEFCEVCSGWGPSSYRYAFIWCSDCDLYYTNFIMRLPTVEDKVMVLSKLKDLPPYSEDLKWKEIPNANIMHHIYYFEDLQASGEKVTGYALKYDFLKDQILIKRTEGVPEEIKGKTVVAWPPVDGLRNSLLFAGSPATLANHILAEWPLVAHEGFDFLIKIILAEWMVRLGRSLAEVQAPAEHKGTFTLELRKRLKVWERGAEAYGVEGPTWKAFLAMPFPNRWSRENVDLEGFKAFNCYAADPEGNRSGRPDGTVEEVDNFNYWRDVKVLDPLKVEGIEVW